MQCWQGGLRPISYSANITLSIIVNMGGVAETRPMCNADTIPPLPCYKHQWRGSSCVPKPLLSCILFNSINGKTYAPVNLDRIAREGGSDVFHTTPGRAAWMGLYDAREGDSNSSLTMSARRTWIRCQRGDYMSCSSYLVCDVLHFIFTCYSLLFSIEVV